MAKFKTSARSVDMLGRQQIAGIPTAISEIFKNAYDAYATSVRGDFIPGQRIIMIRDNGIGMSEEDLLTRWLTIGTDSKMAGTRLALPRRPDDVPARRQMGEKGIGRLAIATTGPQLLLVSRAFTDEDDPPQSIVVAVIQWSLFESPGLTLDDVVIPVRTVAEIDDIDQALMDSMRGEIAVAVDAIRDALPDELEVRIRGELEQLSFDPRTFLRLNGPGPNGGRGTAFIVRPVNDDVDAAMELPAAKADEFAVSEFQRFLLGFVNSITEPPAELDFSTEFIRHETSSYTDLIDPASYFWESTDFAKTDHTVDGRFDETGTFSGTLSIYGADDVDFIEAWPGSKRGTSACGPFRLKFGYVQGQKSESKLTDADWAQMTGRLEKIGGLYIYRDGIRVLPYGNSDTDYLEIEKRRTLNAGRYYFSYRRMFGAIELDSSVNRLLQEKAGREGFRENRAYRDFKDILKNFFIQLAANFFSAESEGGATWRRERDRMRRRSAANAAREQRTQRRRDRFAKDLADRLALVESGEFADSLASLVDEVRAGLESGETQPRNPVAIEAEAMARLRSLRAALALDRPSDLGLSSEVEREWAAFTAVRGVIDALVDDAAGKLQELLARAPGASDVLADERETRARRIRAQADGLRADIASLSSEVSEAAATTARSLAEEARRPLADFEAGLADLLVQAPGSLTDEVETSARIDQLAERQRLVLTTLAARISDASADADRVGELVDLQERVLDLQEQVDTNVELLQLGQAVQIVSHEFDASIRSVRSGLRQLDPWAKTTPRLAPVVRDLRASFAHLDAYLRLFTPLQRRLYGEAVSISGEEIADFVAGVFTERLPRHEVELVVTDAFRNWTIVGYPSTFYPAFTNLVDNAIYWVSSVHGAQRTVTLDADDEALYVRDTGPGVRPRDRDAIFERGFGRRRGGRGLGLSLARELLERDGWHLDLADSPVGAVFRMWPEPIEESEERT